MRDVRFGRATAISILFTQLAFAAIQLQSVTTSVSSPMAVMPALDGSNRLFIVQQGGIIRVLQPGATTPTTFLDIHTKIVSGGEQGLLGLAFHPQYATNGRFFVYYTRAGDMALQIAEYHVSSDNPNVADTAETIILTIPHPTNTNHNGGNIIFGPDGYLYAGTGDGGSGDDPPNNAQNINVLLGKILRVDIDHPNGAIPYSSPASNPFYGQIAGADEIYAYGMRNPWRWSFDRGGSNGLYCGDVGQNLWEEIDLITLGGNFGWRVYEGFHCTNNDALLCTDPNSYTLPLAEYGHTGGRCAIVGGYIYRGYRGTLPAGAYTYADECTGEIFQFNPPATGGAQTLLLDTPYNISSFGQDEAGELYVCSLGGAVYRISANPAPAACSYSIAPSSISVDSSGAGGSFTLTTGPDCGWTVKSHASWITANAAKPSFGVGTTSISYTVAANDGSARTGTIQIAGQTFTVSQAGAVSPTAWRSVRTHAGAGNLSIPLNATATGNGLSGPTVETRIGGIQRIELDFSGPITLADPSKISVIGYNTANPNGASFPPAGVSAVDADTLAITFPASPAAGSLPDMTCYVIQLLPGLTTQIAAGDQDVMVRALVGDTTMEGAVNLSDAIFTRIVALANGTAPGFPEHDLDISGSAIDLADALAAKSRVSRPARQSSCP